MFNLGRFIAASGNELEFKIECDDLTDSDWECIAFLGNKLVKPFKIVHGVPTGGWRFAEAMFKYRDPSSENILIVDDVWTTGKSMKEYAALGGIENYQGLVLFNREETLSTVKSIFYLNYRI